MVENYSVVLGVNVAGIEVSVFGVMLALVLSIFFIIRKMNPALAMFTGVFAGAIVGGANLPQMVDIVILGGRQVVGANVRILAGGFLVGALIETGAAETIARGIVKGLGEKRAIFAIALSAMIVTGAGVFITVAMLIVSPIALSVAYRANISKFAAILAISGGAKAGNVISPNPNALAAAESFGLPLSEVMLNGLIPGIVALVVTVALCKMMQNKHFKVEAEDLDDSADAADLPSFGKAIVAPAVAIGMLMLNPIGDILGIGAINSANLPMDPFFVLPIGAVAGLLVLGKGRRITEFATKGVLRMAPIMLVVFGAGAIGGLITVSVFPAMIEDALYRMGIPTAFLAPLSSTIFASVTGSATAGIIIGGESFGATILAAGVPALAGAVMLHAGGGFLDAVPHSSGFLATQQAMKCTMAERMRVMPWEFAVGGAMTLTSVGMYLLGFWG
ncbi:MAG: GntP family permease [Oscillospiraceae bacterium]|nr:GntP family permease [Oscillospiraceae bacterium]